MDYRASCAVSHINALQVLFSHRKWIKLQDHWNLQFQTLPIDVASHRQLFYLAVPSAYMVRYTVICWMGLRFGVSVLSLVEPQILSKCLHRFTARFFINLRAISYHQRASVFENRAPTFDPSPAGTRPLRRQSDRLVPSNFIHVEMEKTIYSSGTNPDDGDIEHRDIIDLKVIDPHTHQRRRWRYYKYMLS